VARNFEAAGAGEIVVNNIDRDGEMTGYDIDLMASVCEAVNIPVIACGGAGKLEHIRELFEKTEARAAAAGSLFVFHGPHRGVLINYPTPAEIKAIQR
jgi:cyclase